jgi:hypothetical protein
LEVTTFVISFEAMGDFFTVSYGCTLLGNVYFTILDIAL